MPDILLLMIYSRMFMVLSLTFKSLIHFEFTLFFFLLGVGKVADLSKKGQEPFPQWAFIGFNVHRIQVKLINHCQAVMIKQQITFKEL